MTAGLRYVGANQVILGVILITLVINLLYFPYLTLLPVFARDVLKQGPMALGMLGASTGIGAFLGLLLINLLRRRVSNGVIFVVGTFLMVLFLLLFALSTNYAFSWSLLFLAGLGEACFVIMQSSLILLAASDEMRGRVLGLLMVAIGIDPVGKLLTGFLAEHLGAPLAIVLQSGVAAVAILVVAIGLPGLRGQAQAPAIGQAATVPLND
jgi:MFS family permease